MPPEIKKLNELINNAGNILIVSHISPDPDAACSLLLLGQALITNFKDKNIAMVMEEKPLGLEFLEGFRDIEVVPLENAIEAHKPELFIIVDAMNLDRCTRKETAHAKKLLADYGSKIAVIDHHEPIAVLDNDAYINQGSVAATQDVYELCFDAFGLKKPPGYAETAAAGIYSDSGAFSYPNRRHKETFRIINELLENGLSIESVVYQLNTYSKDQMTVIAEFAKNITCKKGYTYSYLPDDVTQKLINEGLRVEELNRAAGMFVNEYIRNINSNKWGFIVYPSLLSGEGMYAVSFRSLGGLVDVSKLAEKLGGGGHKPAAAAKIHAGSTEEAIKAVEAVIN